MPCVLQTRCHRLYDVLNEVWCGIDLITATLHGDMKKELEETEIKDVNEMLEKTRMAVKLMHSESPYLCRLQEIRAKSWEPVCADQADRMCIHDTDTIVKMLASLKRKLQQIDCLLR